MENSIPIIAIVGRPNAGKSTLFNQLGKEKKAIVYKEPGVTRDFQVEKITWQDKELKVVDTSGFEIKKNDELRKNIEHSFLKVLDQSQGFIFLCDGQAPINQLDMELIQTLRKQNKPIIPVVNKMDTSYFQKHEGEFYEFLGKKFLTISAEKGLGLSRLIKEIEREIPLPAVSQELVARSIKIVIMGRPNVGKSTLMNQLLNEERVVVSPIPGTTRDSIDAELTVQGESYTLIDTAGLRKKSKISEKVEYLSTQAAIRSLEKAQILLLVIDAQEGPKQQDIKVAKLAWDRGVGIILLINKWDLLPDDKKTNTYWQKVLWHSFRHFNRIPFLFISALERRNILKIFEAVSELKVYYEQVIESHKLKDTFLEWITRQPHPMVSVLGRRTKVRFYSCKQIKNGPPVFEVKTNFPEYIREPYNRFLMNQFRETYGFWGIPIKIVYKR